MKTLEQIALEEGEKVNLWDGVTGIPPETQIEYIKAVVAALGAQEPVAEVADCGIPVFFREVGAGGLLYAAPVVPDGWQPIETAPRGSGEDGPHDTRHPDYVSPPTVLLWTEDGAVTGYYDWYYHEGYGMGAEHGVSAWRQSNGEQAFGATHWMPLPAAPEAKP